mgnify:CR=1 FL=1
MKIIAVQRFQQFHLKKIIVLIQDQKYVFVVGKDGIARSRNIKIAYELPDIYIVESGLNEGENFILDGIQKVKEDQKVNAEFKDPKKVLQSLKLKAD